MDCMQCVYAKIVKVSDSEKAAYCKIPLIVRKDGEECLDFERKLVRKKTRSGSKKAGRDGT